MSGARTGAWSAFGSVAALAIAGAVGVALKQPWVFPSLGPTLMVMFETPRQPAAQPRNVLAGHAVGIGAGWLALWLTNLRDHPSAVQEGLHQPRVIAACVAMGLTALLLQVLRTPHPPAGATTLIVSLGVLRTGPQLRTMALSVVLVTAVAVLLQQVMQRSRSGAGPSSGSVGHPT